MFCYKNASEKSIKHHRLVLFLRYASLFIHSADRFRANSTSGEVPEWEQICKPITPPRLGDRDPSSVGSSHKSCLPTREPSFQRKKVPKGVKVRVEWVVIHTSDVSVFLKTVTHSHQLILVLCVYSYTFKHNKIQQVKLRTWFSQYLSPVFLNFLQ